MPKIKLKNPPQGGEKWLCLTIFFTMLLAVVSTVGIIYAIVIIYLPSIAVLESGMTGMAFPVVEFSKEGYKIRKVFG